MEEKEEGIRLEDFDEEKQVYIQKKIIDMEVLKGREIFGEKAYRPEKYYLRMWLDSGRTWSIIPMPRGLEYRDGEFYVVDVAMYKRSITNERSKWKEFLEQNGIPKIGKEITVEV